SQSAPTVVITVRATRVWLVDRDLISLHRLLLVLFFIVTAPPSIYTLSLHDALPISVAGALLTHLLLEVELTTEGGEDVHHEADEDRKSTRLNSSHVSISYAVFCLKKKNTTLSLQSQARHSRTSHASCRRSPHAERQH